VRAELAVAAYLPIATGVDTVALVTALTPAAILRTAALGADSAVDNFGDPEVELATPFVVVADVFAPSVMAALAGSAVFIVTALDAEAALIVAGRNTSVTFEGAALREAICLVAAAEAISPVALMAGTKTFAVAVVATFGAGDNVFIVDAALQLQLRAKLAVHEVKAFGIVAAAFGAGERLILLVDAAFQLQLVANREAETIQTADLACGAFDISAARSLAILNTVNAATARAWWAATIFTRDPALFTDQRRLFGCVSGRRALVSHCSEVVRSCCRGSVGWGSRSCFLYGRSRGGLLNDRSGGCFLYDRSRSRFLRYLSRLIQDLFAGILGGDLASAAERGSAGKSAEQPFQHPPSGGSLRHRTGQGVEPFVVHAFLLFRRHLGFRQQAHF
jgi:hypothetical protein